MAKAKTKENPLFLHATGQWAKKVRGRMLYFGKDLDSALKRWADEKDQLLAGRPVVKHGDKANLSQLGNLYVDSLRKRHYAGDITARCVASYTTSISRLIDIRGGSECPEHWGPLDFASIKQAFFEPVDRTANARGVVMGRRVERRSTVTVDGDIRAIRAFLNWCVSSELISPPRYGKEFRQTPKNVLRKRKVDAGRRDIPPKNILKILANCSTQFRPIVLLGINAGIGARDIAHIRMDQLDGKTQWLDLPRLKTGAKRRIWLWPETRQAINDYLELRMTPKDLSKADVLFVTSARTTWMRGELDGIGNAFTRVRDKAAIAKHTFYDLRRTFQTVGDETRDFPAVKHVMGHVANADDMSAIYSQDIDDGRIKRVCSHVRKWLFGGAK